MVTPLSIRMSFTIGNGFSPGYPSKEGPDVSTLLLSSKENR